MEVELYWNVRLKKYSVRALEGEHKGKVFTHTRHAQITNGKFVVRSSGQNLVRKSGQKNVHAFIRGYLNVDEWHINYAKKMLWRRVRYNPYKDDFFMVQKFSDPTVYKEVDKDAYYAVRLETHEDKPRIYI